MRLKLWLGLSTIVLIFVLGVVGTTFFLRGRRAQTQKTEEKTKLSVTCPPGGAQFTSQYDKATPHPQILQSGEISETWKLDSKVTVFDGKTPVSLEDAVEATRIGDFYAVFTGAEIETDMHLPREQRKRKTGIAMLVSKDLTHWTYKGMAVESDLGVRFSHPWILELEDGYRMFYQVNREGVEEGTPNPFSIWSAYSIDGLNWQKEGLVIGGEKSHFLNAAHGRAQKLGPNNYIMVFSGRLKDRPACAPGDIWIARSEDGKNWQISDEPLAYFSHDPTIWYRDGVLKVYYYYLDAETGGIFYVESQDKGKAFSEPKYIVLLNEYGYDISKKPPRGQGAEGGGNIDFGVTEYFWHLSYHEGGPQDRSIKGVRYKLSSK